MFVILQYYYYYLYYRYYYFHYFITVFLGDSEREEAKEQKGMLLVMFRLFTSIYNFFFFLLLLFLPMDYITMASIDSLTNTLEVNTQFRIKLVLLNSKCKMFNEYSVHSEFDRSFQRIPRKPVSLLESLAHLKNRARFMFIARLYWTRLIFHQRPVFDIFRI